MVTVPTAGRGQHTTYRAGEPRSLLAAGTWPRGMWPGSQALGHPLAAAQQTRREPDVGGGCNRVWYDEGKQASTELGLENGVCLVWYARAVESGSKQERAGMAVRLV